MSSLTAPKSAHSISNVYTTRDSQTTTLIGAVNDTVVVESMEHEDSAMEFTNMAIWFGGGEGSWRLEVEEVIVIAANRED